MKTPSSELVVKGFDNPIYRFWTRNLAWSIPRGADRDPLVVISVSSHVQARAANVWFYLWAIVESADQLVDWVPHHHEPLAFPPFVGQWIPEKKCTTYVVGIYVSTVRLEWQATCSRMVWILYWSRVGSTCPAHKHEGFSWMRRVYVLEGFKSYTGFFQAIYTQCTNRYQVDRVRKSPSKVGLILTV